MRTTLKDIANRCGVSVMLVSAVLNRKQKGIGCSEERRQQILETARELDYRPNLLARSVVSRRSPVVGVMLNVEVADFGMRSSAYFNRVFPALTFLFNEHQLEVLFIPYRDEEDQCKRLERLTGNGIVGGIVTNLIPHSYSRIVPKLTGLDLPYMILGHPYGFQSHCVYGVGNYSWRLEYERRHRIQRSFVLTEVKGELVLFPLPWPDDYMWLAEPVPLTETLLDDEKNLFLCSGIERYRQLSRKPRHAIVVEDSSLRDKLPPGVPAVLFSDDRRSDIIALTVKHIAEWMSSGCEPEPVAHRLASTVVSVNLNDRS